MVKGYPAPRCFRWNRHVHGFPHRTRLHSRALRSLRLCARFFAQTDKVLSLIQQARPKLRVNSIGGINDLRGDFVWLHGSRRVAEVAEENKPRCGRHSTENNEEPKSSWNCMIPPFCAEKAGRGSSGWRGGMGAGNDDEPDPRCQTVEQRPGAPNRRRRWLPAHLLRHDKTRQ